MTPARPQLEVAVVVEPGPRMAAVLDAIDELARSHRVYVSLVAVVPHDTRARGCGVSPMALNEAIDEAATADLEEATNALPGGVRLIERAILHAGTKPGLSRWLADRGPALVLLPGRRRWLSRQPRHPFGRRLRRLGGPEIRVV